MRIRDIFRNIADALVGDRNDRSSIPGPLRRPGRAADARCPCRCHAQGADKARARAEAEAAEIADAINAQTARLRALRQAVNRALFDSECPW